jgi:translation initiation factor IF-2
LAKTAKGKGIRVSVLAKELGIDSKVILEKCRQEGLGDKVLNHSSNLALGLAETIREWKESGALDELIRKFSTKSDTVAKKKKKPTAKSSKTEEETEPVSESTDTEAVSDDVVVSTDTQKEGTPLPQEQKPVSPPKPVPAATSATVEIVSPPENRIEEGMGSVPAPSSESTPRSKAEPVTETSHQPVASEPEVELPPRVGSSSTPATPSTAPASPVVVAPRTVGSSHGSRPTVKLESRSGPVKIDKPKPVAQPFIPRKAELQGPKVIREEQPDIVAPPRKRSPSAGGPPGQTTSIGIPQPADRGGRGVRGVRIIDDEEESDTKKGAKKVGGGARRRGPDGRRGEADEKLREFTEQDLRDRADRILAASAMRQATDRHLTKTEARGTHTQTRSLAQRGGVLEIEEPITVRSLSAELGVKSNEIIAKLMKQGVFATVNQSLDFDAAALIALQYNVELKVKSKPSLEDELLAEFNNREVKPESLVPRPPVVTILGHVDHGKTSLLDKIRSANVAAGESGGITQHIAAWQVKTSGKQVTFIDTPGHQAFTAMRARGANMTDVVVLVVSAAEGVQPQTIESINHAKAAGVPIVVALNKIDRDDANPQMVMGQLAANGLNPSEWGGDTEVVKTSAITGQGIDELIEVLDYQTQLRELKADPTGPARGTVIESRMDPGLGPVATVLVQDGTLKVGDVVLAGIGWGRVRSILNDQMKPIPTAGPSTPVVISGLSELPQAGDKFYVVNSLDRARAIAQERVDRSRAQQLADKTKVSLESLYGQMKDQAVKTINLIIKADVQGSVETLQKTVTDQNTDEVRVKVIHAAVGPITESDVELADASNAVIIGFHVVPDEAARAMAEQRRIEIRTYRVIYEIFDDLKKALSGMLEPEVREKLHGHAEVRQVFKVSRLGNIAGCYVTDGHIQRGSKIRLVREGRIITEDLSIESLKRLKDDVKEVKSGLECGIKLAGYDDIKVGDVFEAYIRETFQRTL